MNVRSLSPFSCFHTISAGELVRATTINTASIAWSVHSSWKGSSISTRNAIASALCQVAVCKYGRCFRDSHIKIPDFNQVALKKKSSIYLLVYFAGVGAAQWQIRL